VASALLRKGFRPQTLRPQVEQLVKQFLRPEV